MCEDGSLDTAAAVRRSAQATAGMNVMLKIRRFPSCGKLQPAESSACGDHSCNSQRRGGSKHNPDLQDVPYCTLGSERKEGSSPRGPTARGMRKSATGCTTTFRTTCTSFPPWLPWSSPTSPWRGPYLCQTEAFCHMQVWVRSTWSKLRSLMGPTVLCTSTQTTQTHQVIG